MSLDVNKKSIKLDSPLTLPCGTVILNRLVKSAMTEGLASQAGQPTESLMSLYKLWGNSGAGLLISGNIMVDRDHLERPGNVVIESRLNFSQQKNLKDWVSNGRSCGAHFFAQLNHAGRQTQKPVNRSPKAPSAVKVDLPGGQFGDPIELTISEINEIIQRFAECAEICKEVGFTGIQIHAAHGYLISQFLSPRTNLREDEYGGSLKNRARFLIDVYTLIRKTVGDTFPISVKLNSADFQLGGFDFNESRQVSIWLEDIGIDLIEISGGNYEQPKLLGTQGFEKENKQYVRQSTKCREAYFVDFAIAIKASISIPIMVTGGFRKRIAMQEAIDNEVSLIGIARPMCVMHDAPKKLLLGLDELPRFEDSLSLLPRWLSFLSKLTIIRMIALMGVQFWYYAQIVSLAEKGAAEDNLSVFTATIRTIILQSKLLKK